MEKNKFKLANYSHHIAAFVCVAVIFLVVALSITDTVKPIKFGQKPENTFADEEFKFTFAYPENFKTKETIFGDSKIISVFPASISDEYDPRVIEIAYERNRNPDLELDKIILSLFPEKKRGQLKDISRDEAEGYEVYLNEPEGTTIYSYFKANDNIYLLKFDQTYYGRSSNLIPINNRLYTPTYYKILNSLDFTPEK